MLNRSVVVQGAASASIDVILRDASDRRWLAGLTRAPPAIGPRTIARTATAAGQLAASADLSERGRRVGGVGQESRAGGLYASPRLLGTAAPSSGRRASPVECRAATPTSMVFAWTDIGDPQVAVRVPRLSRLDGCEMGATDSLSPPRIRCAKRPSFRPRARRHHEARGSAHVPAFIRNTPARGRLRHSNGAGAAGPR